MPFTLAHPAAALLLNRRGLCFSGLVVGSMAPDFPYFVTLEATNQFGHTLPGIILFDLPVSLACLYFFHAVCKAPIISLLPSGVRQRLTREACAPFPLWPLKVLASVCFSIILGAGTHLVWDGFTHENGWLVHDITALQNTPLPGLPPFYKILQHASTVLGLAALWVSGAYWLRPLPKDTGRSEISVRTRSAIWVTILILSIVAGVGSAFIKRHHDSGDVGAGGVAFHAVTGGISGFVAQLALFSIGCHFVRWRAKPRHHATLK